MPISNDARHRTSLPALAIERLERRYLLAASVTTALPSMITDLNRLTGTSDPSPPVVVGDKIFFAADDKIHGREMWVTDGTDAGTRMVKDIRPGATAAFSTGGIPIPVVELDGIAYFAANDGVAGNELWRSDGTTEGTYLIKDLVSGFRNSAVAELTAAGGKLFFRVSHPTLGTELAISDGTAAGTIILDLVPGSGHSTPWELTAVQDKVYFHAHDPAHGNELWVTDGTAAGTTMVADLTAGTSSTTFGEFGVGDGFLLFGAKIPAAVGGIGMELWRSDGTTQGTTLLRDIAAGGSDSSPAEFTRFANHTYFAATGLGGRELWRTDGTPGGTTLVYDLPDGQAQPRYLAVMGGNLYFAANDTFWRSDGTASGTAQVVDTNPHGVDGVRSLTAVGDAVYFSSYGPNNSGRELFRSDGTAEGTGMVVDLWPGATPGGAYEGAPGGFADFNGVAVFVADSQRWGLEVFRSDGTAEGTHPIHDVADATFAGVNYDVTNKASYDAKAYFHGTDGLSQTGLWSSDGTEAGTTFISPASGAQFVELGGILYYVGGATELWRTDGTPLGTWKVFDTNASGSDGVNWLVAHNGLLLFGATDGTANELWRSDGTSTGTYPLKDMNPTGSSFPNMLTSAGQYVFFRANDGMSGNELWRTDGTPEGTIPLKDIRPGGTDSDSDIGRMTTVGNQVFFVANDGVNSLELWASDGTPENTRLVKVIDPSTSSSSPGGPTGLVAVGDTVFFRCDDGVHGAELWKSDGTAEGTVMITDILPGPAGSSPETFNVTRMVAMGDHVYFTASTPAYGRELWRSDGTAAGTVLVRDTVAGVGSGSFVNGAVAGGRLYFTHAPGTPANSRYDLWISDGTSAGTQRLTDFASAQVPGFPGSLFAVGDTLFFVAADFAHGAELWKVDVTESPAPSNGVLTVTGTPGDDRIALSEEGGGIVVRPDDGSVSFAPSSSTSPAGVSRVRVEAGDGHNRLDVTAGQLTLEIVQTVGGTHDLDIATSANVTVDTPMRLTQLDLAGSLTLAAGGQSGLLTNELSIGAAGRLDLADNDLVVDYSSVSPVGIWTGSAYDGLTGYIQSGRIVSSLASGQLKTLGVAEAREALGITGSQTATFSGQSVDSTAVLVKFTWGGDANLDGKINIDDYGRIDGNVAQSGSVFGWFNGDFNLDGKINIDDYGIIDGNINQQDEVL